MSRLPVTVGMVLRGPLPSRTYRVESVGDEQVQMDGVWYRASQIKRWLQTGVLTPVVSEENSDAKSF